MKQVLIVVVIPSWSRGLRLKTKEEALRFARNDTRDPQLRDDQTTSQSPKRDIRTAGERKNREGEIIPNPIQDATSTPNRREKRPTGLT
ncbi:uncharacterized protein BDZ99DRAFT_256509 [Mytilinidion resinicola]|uniref:Uncharacterized protein n=1 Tax=Mytilinidion resinicola TaxID=574789 RepID=A0A6A6YYE0_9PEZI|nr:uncharacterized protein BDZ99DRAFT_256509 [Mytilinidion resinicola]KAF2813453.1 hypothetical protein BDZ99DRAFT_256509 [Mytilinidion resinicola]